jgi:Fe-S cluster assembly scaffold protein SufB
MITCTFKENAFLSSDPDIKIISKDNGFHIELPSQKDVSLFVDFNSLGSDLHINIPKACTASITLQQHDIHHHHKIHFYGQSQSQITCLWLLRTATESDLCIERTINLFENSTFQDFFLIDPRGKLEIKSHVHLLEKKASASSMGAALIPSLCQFIFEPIQYHEAQMTSSYLSYHSVIEDLGRSQFQGLVHIDKAYDNCSGEQQNKNLLMGKRARALSSPRLDIVPSHVMCRHGSATSSLDPSKVYYLESRGFPTSQAKNILKDSFFWEPFMELPEEILTRAHNFYAS